MIRRVKDELAHQSSIAAIAIVIFLCLSLLVNYYSTLEQENQRAQLQDIIQEQAGILRARIEHEINTSLNLTMGALIYVSAHPQINQEEFARLARQIMQYAPYIRNIGLAKDNVISHIYPLQGNEKALGLRYLDNPLQRDAVLRAMQTRQTVIAGPVNLVQGGQGFISRIPIYLDDNEHSYWGITSVVVDVDAFFQEAGVIAAKQTLQISLRGKDALGEQGAVFYGDPSLFDSEENIKLKIPLPQGSWYMAAAPKEGWHVAFGRPQWILILGISLSLVVCFLIYALLTYNAALKHAKLSAEMANEHKSRFFTNMTHELRTPLTAINGVVRLLNSNSFSLSSEQAKDLLNSAERNCQRLIWLVNDILDLKKLESGKMEYHKSRQSILNAVKDAINDVHPYASENNISIRLSDLSASDIQLNIDNMRIQQVVVNLLSNAIKFSPENSTIEVQISVSSSHWRLEVTDYGSGIPEDKMESIFTEFGQAGQPARKSVASTGLGLSISRHIVHDHDGKIGCFNQSGKGATFFVELPLTKV